MTIRSDVLVTFSSIGDIYPLAKAAISSNLFSKTCMKRINKILGGGDLFGWVEGGDVCLGESVPELNYHLQFMM